MTGFLFQRYYAPTAALNAGANTDWANASSVVGVVLAASRGALTITLSSFMLRVISP